MSDFQSEGTITRSWLSLADLAVAPSSGYYIQRGGFGPGEVSFRKTSATSPYVSGQTLTHAVKDQQTLTFKVRVVGSSQGQLLSRMEELAAAMEQFSFTMRFWINGVLYQYECDASDYAVGDGGQVEDLWLRSNTQLMSFNVPHKPVASGFV
jgi:hypothetical protein